MKTIEKIIVLTVFALTATSSLFGQATPSAYTSHYRLREYAQGANPGADSLNQNYIDIDANIFTGKRGAVWPETTNLYDNGTSSLRWKTIYAVALNTSGTFTLTGTASNIALGSNYISNTGADAGLSFDGSNNANLSGSLTAGSVTAGGVIQQNAPTGTNYGTLVLQGGDNFRGGILTMQTNTPTTTFQIASNATNTAFSSQGSTNLTMTGANSVFAGSVTAGGFIRSSQNSASGLVYVDALNAGSGDVVYQWNRTGGTASLWQAYLPSGSTDLRLWNVADRLTLSNTGVLSVTGSISAPRVDVGSGASGGNMYLNIFGAAQYGHGINIVNVEPVNDGNWLLLVEGSGNAHPSSFGIYNQSGVGYTGFAFEVDQNLNAYIGNTVTINGTGASTIAGDWQSKAPNAYSPQLTGWQTTNSGYGDFRYLYTNELHAKAFIADQEQALAGSQIIVKSVAKIDSTDFTLPTAGNSGTLVVEEYAGFTGQVFANSDTVRIRTFTRTAGNAVTIGDAWGQVTYLYRNASNNPPTQAYTFLRLAANGGSASGSVTKGTLVLDYGQGAGGYWEVDNTSGSATSPFARVVSYSGLPNVAASLKPRVTIGNLGSSKYGILGQNEAGATAFRLDQDGASIAGWSFDNTTLSSTGVAVVSGASSHIALGATLPTAYNSGTGIWLGNDGKTLFGNASGNRVQFSGSDITLVATNASITGTSGWLGSSSNFSWSGSTVTAGGFTINSSALYTGSKTAYNDANAGVHFGTDGIGIGNNVFTVSSAGALTSTSANIKSSTGSKRVEILSDSLNFYTGSSLIVTLGAFANLGDPGILVQNGGVVSVKGSPSSRSLIKALITATDNSTWSGITSSTEATAGTRAGLWAFNADADATAGTITSLGGYTARVVVDGATVTNAYGLYINAPTIASGSIANVYGIYATASGGGTSNWAGYFSGDVTVTGKIVSPVTYQTLFDASLVAAATDASAVAAFTEWTETTTTFVDKVRGAFVYRTGMKYAKLNAMVHGDASSPAVMELTIEGLTAATASQSATTYTKTSAQVDVSGLTNGNLYYFLVSLRNDDSIVPGTAKMKQAVVTLETQ